jgi:hypothetical protein
VGKPDIRTQWGPLWWDEAGFSLILTHLFVRGEKNSFTYKAVLKKGVWQKKKQLMKLLVKMCQTGTE